MPTLNYERIVVEPYFNDAHFLESHIHNICEYLKPDVYVIAEGAFPLGPEEDTDNIKQYLSKATLNGEGKRSFDFGEAVNIIKKCSVKYPNVDMHFVLMDYDNKGTEDCYIDAYHSFLRIIDVGKLSENTLIFPLETDLFITKKQAEEILCKSDSLLPGQGFGSTFMEFYESPRVCFQRNDRKRKVVFKYGDGTFYYKVIAGNFNDRYLPESSLYDESCHLDIYPLYLFHYPWIRPDKYFDFRLYDQLTGSGRSDRSRPIYAQARELIRSKKYELSQKDLDEVNFVGFTLTLNNLNLNDHPKHIWNHPNFLYHYER